MFWLLNIERLLSLSFLYASETLCFKGVDGRHAVDQTSMNKIVSLLSSDTIQLFSKNTWRWVSIWIRYILYNIQKGHAWRLSKRVCVGLLGQIGYWRSMDSRFFSFILNIYFPPFAKSVLATWKDTCASRYFSCFGQTPPNCDSVLECCRTCLKQHCDMRKYSSFLLNLCQV